MKNDLTELVFILDKSGSMSGLEKDTIGGFNSLIEKQKKEKGEALVTTVTFDSETNIIHDQVNIKEVKNLTSKDYCASGMTALLDALGSTITHIRRAQSLLKEEDKPAKTLFVITTDGLENASREYHYKAIKKLIDEVKKDNGYEFLFLGANIDSEEEAEKLGIDRENAVQFHNDAKGIQVNYICLDNAIKHVRSKNPLPTGWKNEIKKDYEKRK